MTRDDRLFRVISERHGLLWTGDDAEEAEYQALSAAVATGHTVYVQDGSARDRQLLKAAF